MVVRLFALGFALATCGAPALALAAVPLTGMVAQIGKGGDGMPCFATTDSLGAFIKAGVANDKYGMENALQRAVILRRGDHVRTIETHGWLAPYLRLRIESGDNEGTACWTPSDLDGFFVNVRDGN